MSPQTGLEHVRGHVGDNPCRIAQQLQIGAIRSAAAAGGQHMGDKAVAVALKAAAQPLDQRRQARIALRDQDARCKQ